MKKIIFLSTALLAFSLSAAPKIEFTHEEMALGDLEQGSIKDFSFEVMNRGDVPLEIKEVRPTCGCTSTGKSKFTLKPGAKGTIPFKFTTGRFSGQQHKAVTVVSNDPDRPSVSLQFTANIKTLIDIAPEFLSFQVDGSPLGLAVPQTVKVTNRYVSPLVRLIVAPIDMKLDILPKSPIKNLSVAKDSAITVEVAPTPKDPITENKYGQLSFVAEFEDGKKIDKQVTVTVRK